MRDRLWYGSATKAWGYPRTNSPGSSTASTGPRGYADWRGQGLASSYVRESCPHTAVTSPRNPPASGRAAHLPSRCQGGRLVVVRVSHLRDLDPRRKGAEDDCYTVVARLV